MRRWVPLVILAVAGAVALTACSGEQGDAGAGSTRRENAETASTTPAASDATALCVIFNQLAANGAGPGAQFQATTPEGWERRIATTGQLVSAAPPEWRDEAETYLQMVKDRAQLAAQNGYVGVNDLPADVRDAFIASHRTMQLEVDKLIAFMSTQCPTATAG